MTPLRDWILCLPELQEQGKILQLKPKEEPHQAVVLKTGKLVTQVKRGDKIAFHKYHDAKIKIDGDKVLMVKEEDVLAIINA